MVADARERTTVEQQPPPQQGPYPPLPTAATWPPPAQAWPARPAKPRTPQFVIRAGADRRVLIGAAVAGVGFDIAARHGLAAAGVTAWIAILAAAILLSGRISGRAGRSLLIVAPVLGLVLSFRASPWVIAPATFGVALLLLLGVSLGADRAKLAATFPNLATRIAYVAGHLTLAPGALRSHAGAANDRSGNHARKVAVSAGRGALLGIPVMLVIGMLLSLADPIFRSWFDLGSLSWHLVLLCVGAWILIGLARAASAERPAPPLPPVPALGAVEAACVLGGLCALYAAFVCAQFVALSGAGHRILVTHGMTYAQYARGGFFQLLACAAITFLVLLGVRACANPAHPVLMALAALTAGLTIGVVTVAIRRLQLYEAAYGLTMLRLACLVSAVWIGVVFVLIGSTIPRRGLSRRYLPAAVLLSGLALIAGWSVANPAAIVAQTNLHRAE